MFKVWEEKMLVALLRKCAWIATLAGVLSIVPGADAQLAQPAKVRIGLAGRNFSFLPFFVAEQEKFFAQEGIRTEMIYMRSPVAIPALSAGEIQYTTHFASVVRSAVKGFPVRVILSTSDRQMFSLVAARPIKRIEDLKGKAMAVSNPLGIHAYVTLQILKKFGLDPGKDPRFLYLGEESSSVSAMETGLVSAAFIQPPTSLVLKRKGYNILVNSGDYIELPVTGLSTSVERMQKNPEEVKAVLKSVYRGLRFIKENREGSVKLIAKFLRVEPSIAEETYDLSAKYLSDSGVSSEHAIQAAIENLGGATDAKVDPSTVADFSLLKEAIKTSRR
jgi:ABC-type nitrate/sulfonate/bicarbonate transport system substrate-binding protein